MSNAPQHNNMPKLNFDLSKLPNLTDLSAENLCENVQAINSLCENPRLKAIMERLVQHSHAFVREVGLTTEEWMQAIEFLTAVGQKCSPIRQEFILLSDVLGISALVDNLNFPKPAISTGESIASEGKGEYMLVLGKVVDTEGNPVKGVTMETWETDDTGMYDTQHDGQFAVDCRGQLKLDDDGLYKFRAVRPVPYPIPNDGPVGDLLQKLNRHEYRPAHLHMMLSAPGFEPLTTALYFEGDPFITRRVITKPSSKIHQLQADTCFIRFPCSPLATPSLVSNRR
ncbi:hypothetical protein QFC24_006657 [Naganishia onofrii]|uniref:Uncharacterized protein n=1 Tax=Naganishia onofrii TaxID=1851511 RepID=A0ACC2WZH6_9TREE|nr:hypothetical protein QFC24_006657 [Naganishia onofrii]